MRFAGLDWLNDNSGFYFSRYPKPGTVPPEQERLNHKLYFHKLGGDPDKAELIYARSDNPEISVYPSISFDGKWLMIYESLGTDDKAGVLIAPANEPKKLTRVVELGVASVSIIHSVDNTFYVVTDKDAPRRKLVKFTLDKPTPEHWQTVIDQTDAVIEGVFPMGEHLVVTSKRDVASVIAVHNMDGTIDHQVPLPTVGSASASARPDDTSMFVTFTSYTYPTSIFSYVPKTKEMKPYFVPKVDFDPNAYETRQAFYNSKDGTRVPMFITHKKGIKLDRANPTLLYGYGGFSVGMSPFDLAWLERGGVYAVACIRGGDEYGTAWHDAGKLQNKQNVFDDFHAAAEFLIREGYTQPKHLGINGGSNGGLLVAACMLQRPELYGAVVAEVGVLDMLRYHRWGTGRFWTVEYGNAEASEAQFKNLLAYSPLHNVQADAKYPPTLITTGDGDDRVVPFHSLKFTAMLNHTNPEAAVFLRYDVGSGHGGGKPLTKAMDEQADVFAFLFKALQ
jgi:prolyl oligopeptidase